MNLLSDRIEDFVIFKDYDGKEYFLFEGKDGFRIENYYKGKELEERVKEKLERLLKEKESWELEKYCDIIIGKGPDFYLHRVEGIKRIVKKGIAIEVKNWGSDKFKEMYLSHFLKEILNRFEGYNEDWKIVLIEGKVKIGPEILFLARKLGIIIIRGYYELEKVVKRIMERIERLEAGKNGEVEIENNVYEGILWDLAAYMKELMIRIIVKLKVLENEFYEGIRGIWSDVILKSIFLAKTPRGKVVKSERKKDFLGAGKTVLQINRGRLL